MRAKRSGPRTGTAKPVPQEDPPARAPAGNGTFPTAGLVRRPTMPAGLRPFMREFWIKAYQDNLTGLSAMVAYNLLLSIFPFALLALFVAGRVLESPELERRVLTDLRELFPTTAESDLAQALAGLRNSSTSVGIVALVTSIWIGSSFWGALDTAFCRLYHVKCRTWVQQKSFALAMLGVVLLFMAATVAVPTIQSILVQGSRELPLGLSRIQGLVYAISLAVGLWLLFAVLCLIYWSVPNRAVPWRAVWPGALLATVCIGVVDYAFPFYLSNVSSFAGLGTLLVFIVILLLWFYALAMIILGGGVLNALIFERREAGGRR